MISQSPDQCKRRARRSTRARPCRIKNEALPPEKALRAIPFHLIDHPSNRSRVVL